MIGDQLGDSYKQTLEWYQTSLKFTAELSDFYKERAAIEREAAQRLQQLASKHFDKKAAMSSAASVGPTPVTTAGSLENSTLGVWQEVLKQTENIAALRRQLAEQLNNNTAAELGTVVSKWQAVGDSITQVYSTTKSDLSNCYSNVKQGKTQYDEACQSMEKSRAKGSKKTEQKEEQMINAKNSYLLAIAIGNRVQQKHYYDDEPELLDAIEGAYRARTQQLNRILLDGDNYERQYCSGVVECLSICDTAIKDNQAMKDVSMYVKHNTKVWPGPQELRFEPSPVWHDEPDFDTSEVGLKFLRARLSQADNAIGKATDSSNNIMNAFQDSKSELANPDLEKRASSQVAPLLLKQLGSLKQLVAAETTRITLETELETIDVACMGHDLASVPVTRTKTKRGLLGKKKEVVEVVDTSSHKSGHSGLGIKSLLARGRKQPVAVANFAFEATDQGELSITAGEQLVLLERDDGSGWIKVQRGAEQGIVPATYCEILGGSAEPVAEPSSSSLGPSFSEPSGGAPVPPPSRSMAPAAHKTMIALFDFDGQDSSQLSIKQGDTIEVTEADPGNGWTTGRLNGQTGIFPTLYAK